MKIHHYWTNACLWEGEAETIKEAVEKAVAAGVCLDGASLDRASLVGARLDRASLVGASLVGASLDRASLDGASLDRASLDRASLDGASLDGASLDGASLVGASLDRASLDRASLAHVMCLGPIGSRSAYLTVWFMADGTRRYSTGCQYHITEERFLERVSETHEDNRHAADYRAAVDFARAWSERNQITPTYTEEN